MYDFQFVECTVRVGRGGAVWQGLTTNQRVLRKHGVEINNSIPCKISTVNSLNRSCSFWNNVSARKLVSSSSCSSHTQHVILCVVVSTTHRRKHECMHAHTHTHIHTHTHTPSLPPPLSWLEKHTRRAF